MELIIVLALMFLVGFTLRNALRPLMWLMGWCVGLLLSGCTTSTTDLVKALAQDQARVCAAAEITLPWGTTHAVVCRDNSNTGSTLTADKSGTLSLSATSAMPLTVGATHP